MTRFCQAGKILSLWQLFVSLLNNYLYVLTFFGKFSISFGHIVIVTNWQILKNNITIWSHWIQAIGTYLRDAE